MGLFKDVKKPVIRQSPRAAADISPLRPKFVPRQPPCSANCAAGADVRAWVTTIAQAEAYGRSPQEAYEAAWRILADAHPFPATLGRICPHGCEQRCHRRGKEGAVAVNALERWLGDVALARGFALPERARTAHAGRIAVVGSGPAGLSCAYQLARRGHQVTVFEARDVPGGRLRDATRTRRLADGIVDAEIRRLMQIGIVLRCGSRVGGDPAGLGADHDFVFVATGRQSRDRIAPAGSDLQAGTRHPRVFAGGDAIRPGLVPAALGSGRQAAEAIDAAVDGRPPESQIAPPLIEAERLKLAWYEDAPRHTCGTASLQTGDLDCGTAGLQTGDPNCGTASLQTGDLDCGTAGLQTGGDAAIAAEAKRCLSCGLCMDCERCWMYCTNNCFEKLPKGQHYRVNLDLCNGCRKCADECPCGYVDMV
jgi:Pyruvate/2-oxoacid:ferredoxin oxidoreductase delta subunit